MIKILSSTIVMYYIIFSGPPPPPNNIDISFTKSTAEVTWTEPSYSSQCYSISSYAFSSNITIANNSNTTSTSLSLTGLSVGIYFISIASIDTANRIGIYSEQECFELTGMSSLNLEEYPLFSIPLCALLCCV